MPTRCIFIIVALSACRAKTPSLDDLSCAGSACLAGYTCDTVSDLCVKTPIIDCTTAGDLCAASAQTGDACTLPGFQLPCAVLQTTCSVGNCRTCQNDHTWSSCPSAGSTTGGNASGSSSTGGGQQLGAAVSVVSASGQGFGTGARAIAAGQVMAGTTKDSAQQVTFGFSAIVLP